MRTPASLDLLRGTLTPGPPTTVRWKHDEHRTRRGQLPKRMPQNAPTCGFSERGDVEQSIKPCSGPSRAARRRRTSRSGLRHTRRRPPPRAIDRNFDRFRANLRQRTFAANDSHRRRPSGPSVHRVAPIGVGLASRLDGRADRFDTIAGVENDHRDIAARRVKVRKG